MPYNFQSQKIDLENVINARELGGYVIGEYRVRKGLLLRGGNLTFASDEDIVRLRDEYHLSVIFDFRTSGEVKNHPDREVEGARNVWMPAFNEDEQTMAVMALPRDAYNNLQDWLVAHASEPKVQEVARGLYTEMVSNEFTQIQYAGFLQNIIANQSGAVYWHCSQGKDRTGLGAALILAALGADRRLILEDYSISNEVYRRELEYTLSRVNTEAEKKAVQTFVGVNPEYFSAALDWIDAHFGSMMGFLKDALLLSDEDIEVLRNRYLEKN